MLAVARELELQGLREAAAWEATIDAITEPELDVPPMPKPTGTVAWHFDPDDQDDGPRLTA
jgi:hypothetical protein